MPSIESGFLSKSMYFKVRFGAQACWAWTQKSESEGAKVHAQLDITRG